MAPQSRRGNRDKSSEAAEQSAAPVVDTTSDELVDRVTDMVDKLDAELERAENVVPPETRTASNPGPQSPELAIGTIGKVSSVENTARLNTRRETEWRDLSDVLGPKYVTPDGEPWKILLVTDLTQHEWDSFMALTDYAASVAFANKFVLMHNGWTDEDGNVIPQPGDLITTRTRSSVYELATRPSDKQPTDPDALPETELILDDDGTPLYRLVMAEEIRTIPAAFWQYIPRKLIGWLPNEAWIRSQLLPNLTKPVLQTISRQPNANGTS
jgi:hypothetical protein